MFEYLVAWPTFLINFLAISKTFRGGGIIAATDFVSIISASSTAIKSMGDWSGGLIEEPQYYFVELSAVSIIIVTQVIRSGAKNFPTWDKSFTRGVNMQFSSYYK